MLRVSSSQSASVIATLLAATAISSSPAIAQSGMNTTSLQHEVVLEGLDNPWDMAFLDDGTMLFTEKCKGLSVRLPDGTVNALYGVGETEGYPSNGADLFCEGQAGMMGVAFDPAFADNRRIYVYSTSNMSDPHTNRLMRFTLNDDFTAVADRTDIVDDVPYKMAASDHPFGGPGAHNGGRVRFGPDGALWLTTGDNHNSEVPQSPTLMGVEGPAHGHRRQRPSGQRAARRLRQADLHLRPPQRAGHRLPPRDGRRDHRRARAVALRRDHHSPERRQRRLGSAAEHGGARRLPGRLLRLLPEPGGGHEPLRARGLHADDRFRHLSRRHAADLEQQRLVAGHFVGRLPRRRGLGRLGRRDGRRHHGHRLRRHAASVRGSTSSTSTTTTPTSRT